MQSYINYFTIIAAAGVTRMRPVHSIVPFSSLDETFAPGLKGVMGHGPVRVGSQAANQTQHDAYGSVVLGAMQMSIDERLPKVGDEALFRQLKRLGEHALRYAFEPNSDILEYRERAKVHAYSAALCWAACDRLGQFAHRLRLSKRARYWHAHAVPITDKSLAEVWHKKRGALTGALGHSDLDASVLLCGDLGLFASTDPRFGSTCDVIRCELMRKGRITPYMADDDFGAPETALLACSFCHIGALCLIGRKDDAQQMFDDSFERGNAFGRLSEDIRPETGELWGNFAQAYSMVEIINTATRMSSSWEEEGWARV